MWPEAEELARTRTRVLAWLGLLGVGEFALAVLALHATLNQEPQHLSEYAVGPFPHVWLAAACSFAIAALALTLAMRKCLRVPSVAARAGITLMGIGAVGGLALAAFPVDPDPAVSSLSETIHMGVAYPAFGASAAAMLVLVPGLRGRPAWRPFARVSLVLGLLTLASAGAYAVTDLQRLAVAALVQRAMATFMALWLAALALHLLDLHRQARGLLRERPANEWAIAPPPDPRPSDPRLPDPLTGPVRAPGACDALPAAGSPSPWSVPLAPPGVAPDRQGRAEHLGPVDRLGPFARRGAGRQRSTARTGKGERPLGRALGRSPGRADLGACRTGGRTQPPARAEAKPPSVLGALASGAYRVERDPQAQRPPVKPRARSRRARTAA